MKLRVPSSLLLAVSFTSVSGAICRSVKGNKLSPLLRALRFTTALGAERLPVGAEVVRIWYPEAIGDRQQSVRTYSHCFSGGKPAGLRS